MIRIVSKLFWCFRLKLKIVIVGLFICLNFGVDLFDIVKINLCVKMECWIDLMQLLVFKVIDVIGRSEGGVQIVSVGIDYVFRFVLII